MAFLSCRYIKQGFGSLAPSQSVVTLEVSHSLSRTTELWYLSILFHFQNLDMLHFQFLVSCILSFSLQYMKSKPCNITVFLLSCLSFFLFVEAMGSTVFLHLFCVVFLALLSVPLLQAEDAYKYYTWTVTYGTRSPLGSPQQVGYLYAFLGSIR